MAPPLAALAMFGQAAQGIKTLTDEIKRLPDAARSFVQAFNPAAVERLDFAYKSLAATVGFALEPVILTTTRIVEKFADAISGGMNRLRDPIEKVSSLLLGSLQPAFAAVQVVFDGLADGAKLLMPLMQPAAAVFEAIAGLGYVLTTVGMGALLEVIKQIVPETKSLAEITSQVSIAFVKLAESTLRLADFMLNVAGLDKAMEGILTRLAEQPKPDGRRMSAPAFSGMSGLEDIYRRRLVEAAKGGGKSVEEQSRDYLADLRRLAAEMLKELKERPEQRVAARQRAAGEAAREVHDVAMGGPAIRNVMGEALGDAVDVFMGGPVWRRAIDWITGNDRQNQRNNLNR